MGIGLFLTFIGLNETGIVRLGVPGAPVSLGNVTGTAPLLAVFCFFAIALLSVRRVPGAILIGMLATTFLSFLLGASPAPERWVGLPPGLSPILLQVDLRAALSPGFFPVVLTVFVMAFVDTVGTLIGLSARANLLDREGNLPGIEKPMLADALATTVARCWGRPRRARSSNRPRGSRKGGGPASRPRRGRPVLLSLFFAPLFTAVPPQAYGAVLVVIGSYMIAPVKRLDFEDPTELIPCFLTISLISFTYNIGVGMTAGIISYPLLKVLCGRWREVPGGLWSSRSFRFPSTSTTRTGSATMPRNASSSPG